MLLSLLFAACSSFFPSEGDFEFRARAWAREADANLLTGIECRSLRFWSERASEIVMGGGASKNSDGDAVSVTNRSAKHNLGKDAAKKRDGARNGLNEYEKEKWFIDWLETIETDLNKEGLKGILAKLSGDGGGLSLTGGTFKKRKSSSSSKSTLDFENFSLSYLPEELFEDTNDLGKVLLSKVSAINLKNNKLSKLPNSIGNFKALSRLACGSNSIEDLPCTLGEIRNISIDNNGLKTIPARVIETNPVCLVLEQNDIETIPESIANAQKIEKLYLGRNMISVLAESVFRLQNLKSLNLQRNRIGCLPPEVKYLVSLTTLDLSFNALEALPDELGELEVLSALSVKGNALTAFPQTFHNLRSLRTLIMSSNNFKTLPDVCDLSSLITIKCEDNPIEEPPSYVVAGGIKSMRVYFQYMRDNDGMKPMSRETSGKRLRSKKSSGQLLLDSPNGSFRSGAKSVSWESGPKIFNDNSKEFKLQLGWRDKKEGIKRYSSATIATPGAAEMFAGAAETKSRMAPRSYSAMQ